jgi:MSHA biogenesis protein MshO
MKTVLRTSHQQFGFSLVELIMVIVITGILGGIVAVFLRAPIQQYWMWGGAPN